MSNFSLGLIMGTAVGVGVVLTLHPMNKRSMRRAYHRAGKIMDRMGDAIHDWTC